MKYCMSFNHLYSYNGIFLKQFNKAIWSDQTSLNLFYWQSILLKFWNWQPTIYMLTSSKMIELDPIIDPSNILDHLTRSTDTNWPSPSIPDWVYWQTVLSIGKRVCSNLSQTWRLWVETIGTTRNTTFRYNVNGELMGRIQSMLWSVSTFFDPSLKYLPLWLDTVPVVDGWSRLFTNSLIVVASAVPTAVEMSYQEAITGIMDSNVPDFPSCSQ
jgi:hypothetical protein